MKSIRQLPLVLSGTNAERLAFDTSRVSPPCIWKEPVGIAYDLDSDGSWVQVSTGGADYVSTDFLTGAEQTDLTAGATTLRQAIPAGAGHIAFTALTADVRITFGNSSVTSVPGAGKIIKTNVTRVLAVPSGDTYFSYIRIGATTATLIWEV